MMRYFNLHFVHSIPFIFDFSGFISTLSFILKPPLNLMFSHI